MTLSSRVSLVSVWCQNDEKSDDRCCPVLLPEHAPVLGGRYAQGRIDRYPLHLGQGAAQRVYGSGAFQATLVLRAARRSEPRVSRWRTASDYFG